MRGDSVQDSTPCSRPHQDRGSLDKGTSVAGARTAASHPHLEEIMKCPHLNHWIVATCKIDGRIYVPSVFQLHEYCRTRGYKKCPFFVKDSSKIKEVNGRNPVGEYA